MRHQIEFIDEDGDESFAEVITYKVDEYRDAPMIELEIGCYNQATVINLTVAAAEELLMTLDLALSELRGEVFE